VLLVQLLHIELLLEFPEFLEHLEVLFNVGILIFRGWFEIVHQFLRVVFLIPLRRPFTHICRLIQQRSKPRIMR